MLIWRRLAPHKKSGCNDAAAYNFSPRQCRFAGIPNQDGSRWSQAVQLRVRRTSDAHSHQTKVRNRCV